MFVYIYRDEGIRGKLGKTKIEWFCGAMCWDEECASGRFKLDTASSTLLLTSLKEEKGGERRALSLSSP